MQIARGLGKETVAEFVTDADTRRAVQRLGVDFAQGAYVSMPVPLGEAMPVPLSEAIAPPRRPAPRAPQPAVMRRRAA